MNVLRKCIGEINEFLTKYIYTKVKFIEIGFKVLGEGVAK